MSTRLPSPPRRRPDPAAAAGRWFVPAVAVVLGLVALVSLAARGDVRSGLVSFGVLAGYAALLAALGGRSETMSLLRGETVDERAALIHLKAAAVTGHVLIVVLVGGFLVAQARGTSDAGTWSGLCAVGGLTFGASLAVLTRRS